MGLLSKAEEIQEKQGNEIYGRSPLVGLLSHTLLNKELKRVNRELSKTFKETDNRIHKAIMSPPDRLDGLAVKTCSYYGSFDNIFPTTESWKTAMEQAGCKFTGYIKKVQRETNDRNKDDIYDMIVVYLEKEYPQGTLRSKVEMDVAFLAIQKRPEVGLCEEVEVHIKVMDMEAKKKIEEGI